MNYDLIENIAFCGPILFKLSEICKIDIRQLAARKIQKAWREQYNEFDRIGNRALVYSFGKYGKKRYGTVVGITNNNTKGFVMPPVKNISAVN